MKINSLKLICVFLYCTRLVQSDSWITLWNKVDHSIKIHCKRDGLTKEKDFKSMTVKSDGRYDIKGQYPMVWLVGYYRHWCEVKSNDKKIKFDVFGGSDKRINKFSDSYSDWVITRRGVFRVKDGKVTYYYAKDWLIEDDDANTHSIDGGFVVRVQPIDSTRRNETTKFAPLEVEVISSNLPIRVQQYAIREATTASNKYKSNEKQMGKMLSNSMKKEFGSNWAVFIDQSENNKVVKRTCDMDHMMMFQLNQWDIILCQVMR